MSEGKKIKSGRARKRIALGASNTTDERSKIIMAWAEGKSLSQISKESGKSIGEVNRVLKAAQKEIVEAVRAVLEAHEQIEKNRREIQLLGEMTRRLLDELKVA